MHIIFTPILLLLLLMCSRISVADESAPELEWELGAGVGVINFQLYPGARQTKTYVLPLPYFTLRSEYLEIDRGIRGIWPSGSHWSLDISADFGLPVDSDESQVRAGMPDLDAILQLGPSLEYSFAGGGNRSRGFRLELPLRTAIAVDPEGLAHEGWLFEPRLVYEKQRKNRSGLFAKVKIGLRYATQDYHAYYYDVAPAFATPQRALFESEKGYSGLVLDLRATWREQDVVYWAMMRYQNLTGAVFEASPLVEEKSYYFLGIGISWILAHSL